MTESGVKARHIRAVGPPESPAGDRPMIDQDDLMLAGGELDPEFLEVTEQITERLQAGDEIDVRDYVRRYPQWAGAICKLLPTMQRSRRLWPGRRPRPQACKTTTVNPNDADNHKP